MRFGSPKRHVLLVAGALAWAVPVLADGPTLAPPAVAALRRIDTLLAEMRPDAAATLADSLLLATRTAPQADSFEVFAVLDTVTRHFASRVYPTHAVRYGEALLEAAPHVVPPASLEMARLYLRRCPLRLSVGDIAGGAEDAARALGIARTLSLPPAQLADFLEASWATYGGPFGDDSVRVVLEHSLELRRLSAGDISLPVANTMRMLASLERNRGNYAEAVATIEAAIAIAERCVPPDDPQLLIYLNNYGAVLGMLHDDRRANAIFRRCVTLARLAPNYPRLDLARYMNNVGVSEYAMGHYDAARACHDSALAIRLAIGDQGGVTESRSNLSLVAAATGHPAEAESLLLRARAWGGAHTSPVVDASAAAQCFDFYFSAGRLDAAAQYSAREMDALDRIARGHPGVPAGRFRRARLLRARGDAAGAFAVCMEADSLERDHFALMARTLSERQALAYRDSRPPSRDLALTLAKEMGAHERARLWDAVIRGRGQVLDEMAARQRAVGAHRDSTLQPLLVELNAARRAYGFALTGARERTPELDRMLDASRERIERLENRIAQLSLPFREERNRSRLGLAEVRAALPPGAALVAFIQYRDVPIAEAPGTAESRRYAAFVLPAPQSAAEFVPIGSAARVDSMVRAWREGIQRPAGTLAEAAAADRASRAAGQPLRRAVWDAIAPRLGSARTVFIVPDGVLNLVNFAALPTGDAEYLVEAGPLLHTLSSERDLVRDPVTAQADGGLLVVAAPDFDAMPHESEPIVVAALTDPTAGLMRGHAEPCADFAGLHFAPLPGARREGSDVLARWRSGAPNTPAEVLTGGDASEARFEGAMVGRRVVHLATHGFFLGTGCTPQAAGMDAITVRENPLRLSGLALAGANRRGDGAADGGDGILTAEEIAAMNLSGVEWVVLSACDTGLGEIQPGEGVFGLRRALAIAGARTTIMSLWPAEDAVTRPWMDALYRARLVEHRSAAEATRQASLEILRRLRSRGASTRPSTWGAFIAAGDWR